MKEMVGGCCVCSDERGWPDNPLVYCDGNGCTVAVHQACYGIVTVPTGPWYCRKCESPETKGKVRCELCPSKSGALKRTDTNGWAHVVCALYIPEVRFGNVTSMEPIVLRLIPAERYNKTCYICQESNKSHRSTAGACMQCNKSGCKQQFHVTCAQSLGLLCEEAGNYLDNVKYCGYCQHHYSKLKKGGNVKTIPPYKPVLHHSPSSESSEKEGGASPMAGGSGTPTHAAKAKGPGRKSSHTSSSTSGKNTPNSKTPTNSSQPADMQEPTEPPPSGKRQKTSDKNKKKPSPMRRGSGADVSSGSKNNTPAPSPQHSHDSAPPKGGSTPNNTAKATPPSTSPGRKTEPIGVISSAVTNTAATSTVTSASVAVTTSVVQMSTPKTTYQESVITNTEAIDTKQTKKRKAVAQAQAANAPVDYAIPPPPPELTHNLNATQGWDHSHDGLMESQHDKAVKKAKTEVGDIPLPPPHFSNIPPPPPAHSPAALPSPRHLPSPMPGPSGMNQGSNITRSPSLPLITPSDMSLSSPHIFHQPQKAAMDPGMSGHPSHGMPGRSSWGGLNVSYEMQQDPNKPGVSGVAGPSKEPPMPPLPPAPIRNKKRAAMAASMINMATPPPPSAMHTVTSQTMTNVRRPPLPTPPLIYQEIKDSPPSSPSSDNRPLKPKMDSQIITAPHMLGNELNPESMAAARLQEQLTAELAAHAAGQVGAETLIPPPLINKASGQSGSMSRGSSAQSLDQLLERQWEQGSQFLMEQAQHFDIASLLSCLHQLRTENVRLEEHVGSLLQRRDHLLAVNARLAIPLTAAIPGPSEPSRCPRENGSQVRPPPPPRPADVVAERSHQQVMMREPQPKPS